jgi:hypothetical protein
MRFFDSHNQSYELFGGDGEVRGGKVIALGNQRCHAIGIPPTHHAMADQMDSVKERHHITDLDA